AGLLVYPRL
uniref:Periviscerokinin-2 n=1 Tax=Sarcophaga bullata TaxID=7385 RepID=PVK2_SARBU|nr:RecName: Full=Periviscerokinin-2; AltName: Full=Neobu-PVK-2 [Sarcophaga bullata]